MNHDFDCFSKGDAAEDAGDYVLAREFFALGAHCGGRLCWSRLGHLYDAGRGAPLDKARAMSCWRKAWRLGDTTAAHNIAILFRERGKRRESFRWLHRAAGKGGADAQIEIAKNYLSGDGVRSSAHLAARYLVVALTMRDIQPWETDEARLMLRRIRGLGKRL